MATTNTGRRRRRPRTAALHPAAADAPAAKRTEPRRRAPARAPVPTASAAPAVAETTALVSATPEIAFAARVPPPAPERPRPASRRAIFLDVENSSRPQHLAHVVEHLAVDRLDCQTDLVAVANWKVVSHDSARLLAKMGAQLVHSAPSIGVRDWSDLRIAVAAGIWLAAARPGDMVEIVSDDRAFDVVGDVAASLGIGFRRLSYRRLVKEDVTEIAGPPPEPRPEAESGPRGRRRRRRGGRGRSGAPGPPRAEARHRPPSRAAAPEAAAAPLRARGGPVAAAAEAGAHTAPHDKLVSVVRELVDAAPGRTVTIDAVANALKSRGFSRPPGSPRLVTRLRRIRELLVSPSGRIALAGEGPDAAPAELPGDEGAREPVAPLDGSEPEAEAAVAGPGPAGEPGRRRRRRRRRWRGGRRSTAQGAPTA